MKQEKATKSWMFKFLG